MGYLLKSVLGGGLFLGSVALFNVELTKVLDIGTCASGNTPYVIARPCPEGTEEAVLLLVASVFAGLIGAGIYAARGRGPRGGASLGIGSGVLMWGIFFTVTGVVSLIHSRSPEAMEAGSEGAGLIVGITFLVMGVPPLLFAIWIALSSIGKDREDGSSGFAPILSSLPTRAASDAPGSGWISTTAAATQPPAAPGGGDRTIERLERLQRLRESGALTATEFELQKARILRDG